jgi:hypothetical protein
MNSDKNFPVHFLGVIHWLPPYKPDRKRFPSKTNFRALAKFTSDFSMQEMTVLVNYSPFPVDNSNNDFDVRLHFDFLEGENNEISRLCKKCEVLIMDAYMVIAVCRNISLPKSPNQYLDDVWVEKDNISFSTYK